jgi:hypothetical protein
VSEEAPLTRSDLLRALGVVLILLAFLGLATVPGLVAEWLHRDGYRKTQAVVLSPDTSRHKNVTLKLAATGEEIWFRRSAFDGVKEGASLEVWHNPGARCELGLVWYDARLLSASRHPELPGGGIALGWLVATIGLAGLGAYLAWQPRFRG